MLHIWFDTFWNEINFIIDRTDQGSHIIAPGHNTYIIGSNIWIMLTIKAKDNLEN